MATLGRQGPTLCTCANSKTNWSLRSLHLSEDQYGHELQTRQHLRQFRWSSISFRLCAFLAITGKKARYGDLDVHTIFHQSLNFDLMDAGSGMMCEMTLTRQKEPTNAKHSPKLSQYWTSTSACPRPIRYLWPR